MKRYPRVVIPTPCNPIAGEIKPVVGFYFRDGGWYRGNLGVSWFTIQLEKVRKCLCTEPELLGNHHAERKIGGRLTPPSNTCFFDIYGAWCPWCGTDWGWTPNLFQAKGLARAYRESGCSECSKCQIDFPRVTLAYEKIRKHNRRHL